ncbi:MAG: phage tail tip lysozyme [Clostridia bacterium]|nr:phage tail tip lysozyme [Clostridia bacterium]
MKGYLRRGLALLEALVLVLTAAGLAEELGEVDLYDTAIYEETMPTGDVAPQDAAPQDIEPQETAPQDAAPQNEAPAKDVDTDAAAAIPEESAGAESQDAPAGATEVREDSARDTGAEAATAQEDAGPGMPAEENPAPVEAEPDLEAAAEEMTGADPVSEGGEAPTADGTPESAESAAEEMMPEDGAMDGGEQAVAAPGDASATPGLWLGVGEQYPLGTAQPGVAAGSFRSERNDVATVDAATGVVTAIAPGTAQIVFTGADGAVTSVLVGVKSAPKSLSFPAASLQLGKGERLLMAAQLPEGTASARIAYSSSKKSVVTVDASGALYAKKTGTAVITAAAFNGAKASCKVTVRKAPSKVTLSSKSLALCLGEARSLKAKLPKKTASRISWESADPGVVRVDAAGNLTAVAPGATTVTARTFNNKKAVCKAVVLDGKVPTALALNVQSVTLGAKEKFLLSPTVGAGEAALYSYKTSKKKVATVSADGVITAKKAGTAKITVKTQNGLTAAVSVKVRKAPSKVTLSASALSLEVGQTARLSAKLPKGTASAIAWQSSDASVASVDASGTVTAHAPGTAVVQAATFNGKRARCQVTVASGAGAQPEITIPDPGAQAGSSAAARMAAKLRADGSLGSKRDAIAGVVELLIDNGFEPAFAAGVGANIYAEGTYGLFESSKYISNYQKRPRYFCYLDGGDYYTQKDGKYVLTAVYLSQEDMDAYDGKAEKRLRFGAENFYRDNYSGKYIQNVDLNALQTLMETLSKGGWQGKFGLGIVQWTGARTAKLVACYRKHAGGAATITKAQAIAAENEMILNDLKGSYSGVYTAWKKANSGALDSEAAARSAGALVCTRYEIPANKESKAVTRGNKAASIYRTMTGG